MFGGTHAGAQANLRTISTPDLESIIESIRKLCCVFCYYYYHCYHCGPGVTFLNHYSSYRRLMMGHPFFSA